MTSETTGVRLVREAHEKLPPEVREGFVHICNVHATHLADAIDAAIWRAENSEGLADLSMRFEVMRQRAEKAERERDKWRRDSNEWQRVAETTGQRIARQYAPPETPCEAWKSALAADIDAAIAEAERERDEALEQLSKWRATVRRFLGDE